MYKEMIRRPFVDQNNSPLLPTKTKMRNCFIEQCHGGTNEKDFHLHSDFVGKTMVHKNINFYIF